MKQAKNNEIDLLLRKLGRHELADSTKANREGKTAPDQVSGEHLDTDELNAYAENALPTAARTFYTEHLADCARCRKLVAELSLASGTSLRHAPVEIRTPSSLRKYLSSFFSTSALRYVVPALAVIALAAIALMIFRQKPSAEFVAQNQTSTSSSAAREEQETKTLALKDGRLDNASSGSVEPTPNSRASNRPAGQDRPSMKASDKGTTNGSLGQSKEKPIDESSSLVAAEQPAPAPVPATVAPKTQTVYEVQSEPEAAKEKKPAIADRAAANKEEDRDQKVYSGEVSRASPRRTESVPRAGNVQGAASKDAPATSPFGGLAKKRQNEEEVRSVAGHRFRKQGSVWIDSAYDSSRPTVNLSRGSEQYRALVADEPGIGTVAEQLDGEVIVVWKGRVYRIR